MNEVRYETSLDNVDTSSKPTIFLAGPTVRGHQTHLQPSWRYEAIKIFNDYKFDGNIIIPEFSDVTKPDKGNEAWIVPWEYRGLSMADSILFWIPRTKELIGLNTNFEFGFWLGSNKKKVIYGRPEGSYRNVYLDLMWSDVKKDPIQNTLTDTCIAAMNRATLLFHYKITINE